MKIKSDRFLLQKSFFALRKFIRFGKLELGNRAEKFDTIQVHQQES